MLLVVLYPRQRKRIHYNLSTPGNQAQNEEVLNGAGNEEMVSCCFSSAGTSTFVFSSGG